MMDTSSAKKIAIETACVVKLSQTRHEERQIWRNEMGLSPVVSKWVARHTHNRLQDILYPTVNKLRCPD